MNAISHAEETLVHCEVHHHNQPLGEANYCKSKRRTPPVSPGRLKLRATKTNKKKINTSWEEERCVSPRTPAGGDVSTRTGSEAYDQLLYLKLSNSTENDMLLNSW